MWLQKINIKKELSLVLYFSIMVGKTGFEPATPWSQTTCATNCATPRDAFRNAHISYNKTTFLSRIFRLFTKKNKTFFTAFLIIDYMGRLKTNFFQLLLFYHMKKKNATKFRLFLQFFVFVPKMPLFLKKCGGKTLCPSSAKT